MRSSKGPNPVTRKAKDSAPCPACGGHEATARQFDFSDRVTLWRCECGEIYLADPETPQARQRAA